VTDCARGIPGCSHAGCGGHSKRHGGACGAQPLRYVDPPRCRTHLGRSVAVVRAEQGRQEEARRIYAEHGLQAAADPLTALQEQAGKVLAWQAVIEAQIAGLTEIRYRGGNGENVRGEIQVWERALDRTNKILADLVRLGIEDRLVRLTERQGALMSGALLWLLGAFGVDGNEQARALVVTMLEHVGQGRVPAPVDPVLRLVPVEVQQ
jgi:hypothetical protein